MFSAEFGSIVYDCFQIVTKCCNAIKAIFKDDMSGNLSLEGTRAIAQLVQQKSVAVAPELLNCLLSLRIKVFVQ